MAVIVQNTEIAGGIYRMRLAHAPQGNAGQFVMLRIPGALDPFLGRPISLFDSAGDELTLLYQVKGRGTAAFAGLPAGAPAEVQGPYGNGFPLVPGDAVVIGGGIGAAPLHLLVKQLRAAEPNRRVEVHLGFRGEAYAIEAFRAYADSVRVDIGGVVTDGVDFAQTAAYYACGPSPMLRAAAKAAGGTGARLYVSLEKHMACGVGACLGCTCQTANGRKRVCRDGPVFDFREVADER